MYRRESDKYESRGRSHRKYEDADKSSSRPGRSRWDDEKRDRGESTRSRWDSRDAKKEGEIKERKDGTSRDRWKDGKRDSDGSSSSHSASKERRRSRSRSRSRSPFRRDDRDYLNYSNPARVSSSTSSEPMNNRNESPSLPAMPARKCSSWSDSSDEDDQPKRSKETEFRQSKRSPNSHSYRDLDRNTVHGTDEDVKQSGSAYEVGNATFKSTTDSGAPGISLKLSGQQAKQVPLPKVISVPIPVKSTKVAAIFNSDDEDEPEEMPAECKMRMKNVGRETRTSEGPNSFGKTKIGFCNLSHLAEKRLEGKMASSSSKKS